MKKFMLLLAATIVAGGCLTSCSDGEVLSASSAKKALKKEAMFNKDYAVGAFSTGFYEVSAETLNDLAKLKAAGMITFGVETVVEHVKETRGNWWNGFYTVDKEVTHTFATVDLTEEGAKLEVEEPVLMRADRIKDFAANKDYTENVPDYMEAVYSGEVPSTEETQQPADTIETEIVEEVEGPMAEEAETTPAAKPDPNAAYNATLARVNSETHMMRLGQFEIAKVTEVFCPKNMAEEGRGTATLIYRFVDKTPFGYVLGAPQADKLNTAKADFVRYENLGWTVSNLDD